MKLYLVVETADVEILGIRAFQNATSAYEHFETVMLQNLATEWDQTELNREAEGTLRLAGDDSYAAQLFELEVEGIRPGGMV